MSVRNPFVLAGALWGLVLGVCAGAAASGTTVAFAWLFMFGDSPWPAWAETAVLGVGLAVAVAVFLAILWLGVRFARRARAAPDSEAALLRRQARIALVAGIVACLGGLAALGVAGIRDTRERAQLDDQRAFYETLRADGQRITEVEATASPTDRSLRIVLVTDGRRGGHYRLNWSLVAPGYDAVLAKGVREDWLAPGGNRLDLAVDATEIIGAYHKAALGNDEVNVEVDETLRIELSLAPILADEDLAALPPEERQNLKRGLSDLGDHQVARVALRFAIHGSDYRLID